MKVIITILCLLCCVSFTPVKGQAAEDLYQEAKQHAYAGEYKQAKENLNIILLSNARHYDARLLLAQVYAWNMEYELSLPLLAELIHDFAPTTDAYEMFAQVKMWQKDYSGSLSVCKIGLNLFPNYTPLQLLEAQGLMGLHQTEQAGKVLTNILAQDSSHAKAQQLLEQLQYQKMKNAVTLEYSHSRFSNTFTPWHQVSLSYRRSTDWGPVIARMNYAYMFDQLGTQYELDAYPKISKKSYAYLNTGISNNHIFPNFRFGAEYFRLLPRQFEVSGGLRGLNFDNIHLYLYTLQLGHYFNHYWISARGFLCAINQSNEVTGSLTLRRYMGHQDHYFTLYVTSGATPLQVVSLNEIRRLNAHHIALDYQYPALKKTLFIKAKTEYQLEAYEEIRSTQRFSISFSLEKRF